MQTRLLVKVAVTAACQKMKTKSRAVPAKAQGKGMSHAAASCNPQDSLPNSQHVKLHLPAARSESCRRCRRL